MCKYGGENGLILSPKNLNPSENTGNCEVFAAGRSLSYLHEILPYQTVTKLSPVLFIYCICTSVNGPRRGKKVEVTPQCVEKLLGVLRRYGTIRSYFLYRLFYRVCPRRDVMEKVTYTFGRAETEAKTTTVIATVTLPVCGPYPLTVPLTTAKTPTTMKVARQL